MAPFSANSQRLLQGVHPKLVALLTEVTQHFDCTVLGGLRTTEEQERDIAAGLSQTKNSKHLIQPDGFGHAVDVAPTPVRFESTKLARITTYEVECIAFLFYVKGYAKAQGLDVRVGADWNGNNLVDLFEKPDPFNDLDHIELGPESV